MLTSPPKKEGEKKLRNNVLVANPLGKLLNPSLKAYSSLCLQISTLTITPSSVPNPPTLYFLILSISGSQIKRKFGRGLPVRFFTPVNITVEVARLTPRPRREALRF